MKIFEFINKVKSLELEHKVKKAFGKDHKIVINDLRNSFELATNKAALINILCTYIDERHDGYNFRGKYWWKSLFSCHPPLTADDLKMKLTDKQAEILSKYFFNDESDIKSATKFFEIWNFIQNCKDFSSFGLIDLRLERLKSDLPPSSNLLKVFNSMKSPAYKKISDQITIILDRHSEMVRYIHYDIKFRVDEATKIANALFKSNAKLHDYSQFILLKHQYHEVKKTELEFVAENEKSILYHSFSGPLFAEKLSNLQTLRNRPIYYDNALKKMTRYKERWPKIEEETAQISMDMVKNRTLQDSLTLAKRFTSEDEYLAFKNKLKKMIDPNGLVNQTQHKSKLFQPCNANTASTLKLKRSLSF